MGLQQIHKKLNYQAPVVQKLDSAIHWINLYPVDNAIGFPYTYPLDRDLSNGYRYPAFEKLGPEVYLNFPFNLISKLTMTYLTGQWSDLNLGTQFGTQNKDFGAFCRWT